MSGLFASFSIVPCPTCGKTLTITGMKLDADPELSVKECEYCRTKFQVRKDAGGQIILEKLLPA